MNVLNLTMFEDYDEGSLFYCFVFQTNNYRCLSIEVGRPEMFYIVNEGCSRIKEIKRIRDKNR